MERVRERIANQAFGLLPLLLFVVLDNFFSYKLSFIISVVFCVVSLVLYQILKKDMIYQFFLLPSAFTFVLYSIFLCLKLEPMLYLYTPIITEILLIVVLSIFEFIRKPLLKAIKNSDQPSARKTYERTTLNEFYFVVHLVQNFYTLHIFVVVVYSILPPEFQTIRLERFFMNELGVIIGLFLIVYEQIRLMMMNGRLNKEMWLPVLNDKGKVIGCIARSVSRSVAKKYCHPIVRVAVVYQGMMFLVKRSETAFVSSDRLDYPFSNYVLFRRSLKRTVAETVNSILGKNNPDEPRFLLRYMFENEKVKHLVNLYVIRIHSEESMQRLKVRNGKLWTQKQIEDNLDSGIFSEYFEQEFGYLQNTVLLAENLDMPRVFELQKVGTE